jgi:hypothetical protein
MAPTRAHRAGRIGELKKKEAAPAWMPPRLEIFAASSD